MNESLNNLGFSTLRNLLICCKACNLHGTLQLKLSTFLTKVSFFSIVVSSGITS